VPQKSEKNIDMAEIIYYGKKDIKMRRIYFIFLNFRIRMYGKPMIKNPRCQCHELDGI